MSTIKVLIGRTESTSSGHTQDLTREVEFEGEELARRTEYGFDDRRGMITDTRGATETLYKTDDGRLIVHVEDWSRWQGEGTTHTLHEISEADLQANGRFEMLGVEAGYGRPLTLDEALQPGPKMQELQDLIGDPG